MFSVSRNHFYSFSHAITKNDVQKAQAKGKAEANGVNISLCDQVWECITDFFTPAVKVEAKECLKELFRLQTELTKPHEEGRSTLEPLEKKLHEVFLQLKKLATPDCQDYFGIESQKLWLIGDAPKQKDITTDLESLPSETALIFNAKLRYHRTAATLTTYHSTSQTSRFEQIFGHPQKTE